MKLTAVIPVYNEVSGLPATIERLEKAIQRTAGLEKYEILVVDDGSTDETFKSVQFVKSVRLLKHETNQGYGASLKTGIRAAAYPLIMICDADGSYDIESLPQLASAWSPQTLVVALRESIPYPDWRQLKNAVRLAFTFWLWLLTFFWIKDINSGLRLFAKDDVLPFMDSLSDRFSFTTGMTLNWIYLKRPLVYISTFYAKRNGLSKVRFIRDGAGVVRQVVRIAFRYRRIRSILVLGLQILGVIFSAALLFSLIRHAFSGSN